MTDRIPKAQQAGRARATILTAAQKRFAATGYDRTTIRAVAADASIDASMVMRYYGSKEGLFAAATEIDLGMPDLSDIPRDRLGVAVAQHFLCRWEENDSGTPLRVLLSSALAGSAAAEKMTAIFRSQLIPIITAAGVGDATEAAERAALVASQVLGFALCRYVLRLQPIVDLDHQAAVRWLAPTIQSYLTGPAG
jgi:AcrR family transcriptional regulator